MIEELKQRRPEAFKQLVEEHRDKVINTAYRFLYSREDAEEIAQEVFIEVYRSIPEFRAEAKLSTWIYRITVTKSLDSIRKSKRKKRFGALLKVQGMEERLHEIPAPPGADPQQQHENRERLEILRRTIAKLPENQKIALTLSKYDDYSHKEIAEIMGTTISSVESLIHRAKKNLKKKLTKFYDKHL